jgi:hypothetical protein
MEISINGGPEYLPTEAAMDVMIGTSLTMFAARRSATACPGISRLDIRLRWEKAVNRKEHLVRCKWCAYLPISPLDSSSFFFLLPSSPHSITNHHHHFQFFFFGNVTHHYLHIASFTALTQLPPTS